LQLGLDSLPHVHEMFTIGVETLGEPPVNEPAQSQDADTAAEAALEREADAAIAVCDGDTRAALKAVLVANSFLMAEVERLGQAVSFGFTRGKTPARRASETVDRWREISSDKLPEAE
jgi:hypothetical protein